jgi:membrane protein DedA with SNARE-associated domain
VVSLASTTGAALAFLISRYLARDAIARKLRQSPRFEAIDRAVSAGGWKIVALLRLSPAVPFNLQNYLYGLTGIRFWTCVLTSWLAMLPGTLLYVYLGYASRASVEAAAGGRSRSPAEWAFLIAGLVATLAVTVYVTRLARKALQQRTGLAGTAAPGESPLEQPARPRRWPWGATAAALLAVVCLGVAVFARLRPDALERLFAGLAAPPPVTLREAYEERPDGPRFDHSAWDRIVRACVSAEGWVDYRGLKEQEERLDAYLRAVADAPFDRMGRNEKLALLINAYNAFTVRLILDYYPLRSIQDIPAAKRWDDRRWQVGPYTWSLNQIEHEQIRPKFEEPRIHFALGCAAIGCPKLRNEAYRADRLDKQLEDQAVYSHSHERWFRFEPDTGVVYLTRLYLWYGGDFRQVAGSVLDYAGRYSPELRRALEAGNRPGIRWLEYDWSLNSKENAR